MLYRLVVTFCQPYILLCLAYAVMAIRQAYKYPDRRKSLLCLSLPCLALYLYGLPAVAYLAAGTLEWRYPPNEMDAGGQPIVVLGANVYPADHVRTKDMLGENSIYRCLHAAKLYDQSPRSLVIVSGGKPNPNRPGLPAADLMREYLLDLGIPDERIVVQRESRSTYEDAVYTANILRERNLASAILVTSGMHMPRSVRCFQDQGVQVTPSGCRYRATSLPRTILTLLPNSEAVAVNEAVAHEWLGLAWYWLKGRI